MNIVVTGGCGFIGSALIRNLLSSPGIVVINVDKLGYASSPEALESVRRSKGYFFVSANICDQVRMAEIFAHYRPDAIVHLAAEGHVDRSIVAPRAVIDSNILGAFRLLEAARYYWSALGADKRAAFRFLHVSTDEVFGSLNELDAPFTENSPYRPNSPYSASKAASDHLARAWHHTYGLPVIITHSCNNFGPWQSPEKLIPRMIANAYDGKPLPVYGNGRNARDWLYVEDHAHALQLALLRGQPGETYLFGGGNEAPNIRLVEAICRHMDLRFPKRAPHSRLIRFVADRPGHDLRYAVNAAKARQELAWHPTMAFDLGLSATIDWYLRNEDWWRNIAARHHDVRRLGLGQRAAGRASRALPDVEAIV